MTLELRQRHPTIDAGIREGDIIILGYKRSHIPLLGRLVNWYRNRKARRNGFRVISVTSTTMTVDKGL